MSEGISFSDLKEAKEFAQQKGEEGYDIMIEIVHKGLYKVTIGGKSLIGLGSYDGISEITLLPHASTKTRLHELGHKELGHGVEDFITQDELARREIDAESYAYRKMGKEVDYRSGISALLQLIDHGEEPEVALKKVVKVLRKKGVQISNEDKQRLREFTEEE